MDTSAHWIGVLGEGLNFLGAILLALGIFYREKREAKLKFLGSYGRQYGLTSTKYKEEVIASPNFAASVMHWHETREAYAGLGLLALGFLCLVAYHLLEIWHS